MRHKITTIADAIRLVSDWTTGYLERPTEAEIERAARALVAHVGGYGNTYDDDDGSPFDLDAALAGMGGDVWLLRRAIERSGLSARRWAEEVAWRDERTVRRWLSGDSPIPELVVRRLRVLAAR